MCFKVGDLSRTVSESLGDYLQKWGNPAILRPRINTVIYLQILQMLCHLSSSEVTVFLDQSAVVLQSEK